MFGFGVLAVGARSDLFDALRFVRIANCAGAAAVASVAVVTDVSAGGANPTGSVRLCCSLFFADGFALA